MTFHVKHTPLSPLAFLEHAISELKSRDEYRRRSPAPPDPARSFWSNDYLALASQPALGGACGAGASRLVSGDSVEHEDVEREAAALVQQPAALAFSSGYCANVGLLGALLDRHSFVVLDALSHASIIDGVRLSRAHLSVAPHGDASAVAERLARANGRRAIVITESYFSMDADSPDLVELRSVCDRYGAALVVDEAHALGVLGPEGRGLCVERGVRADAIVGTFGKAFGASGAFVAGSEVLIDWLWNRARSFVFSTGMSPAVARAAASGLRTAREQPQRRARVRAAADELRSGLAKAGVVAAGYGHIIP